MSVQKAHWENVYQHKSPREVSWYQMNPVLSLRLIRDTRLALDAAIIDVGGGASTLVDELCESGYTRVSVLDISAKALAHSKHRLAEKVSTVKWYEEDVTRFNPPQRFALWHDRAVFHFLTDRADRESYVNTLKQALEPGGHVIIMAFALDGPTRCSGLDIVQYDAEKLTAELGAGFKLVETGHEVHLTPAGNQQKFAYFRFTYPQELNR
jgi:trans-aconitate methyltransferase